MYGHGAGRQLTLSVAVLLSLPYISPDFLVDLLDDSGTELNAVSEYLTCMIFDELNARFRHA